MRKLYAGLLLALIGIFLSLQGYSQTTYQFTTAGASGRFGPTQAQVNSAYGPGNKLQNSVTVSGQGIQEWTVPVTGLYAITAAGASGGYTPNVSGGKGRVITTHVSLTAGQVIRVLVGQEGSRAHFSYYSVGYAGGGGGGSFVVDKATNAPILIAGGGGGAGEGSADWKSPKLPGVDASPYNVTSGQNGTGYEESWSTNGVGGANGEGGGAYGGGSGGGGFITDGQKAWYGGDAGKAFLNGAEGGENIDACSGGFSLNVPGGFGGGAGAGICLSYEANGGGGGGYSGGGGSNSRVGAGGGGGNFVTGTYISSSLHTGHGYITITSLFNGGEVGADQTFCGSGTPALFNSIEPASGSTVAGYQWQESADNNNWSDIAGATALGYQAPTAYATIYYRRKATSADGATAYSNTITITVNPIPSINTTGLSTNVCVGQVVTVDLAAAGSLSNATYSWTNSNTAIGLAASGSGNTISFTTVNAGHTAITGTITVTPTANGCSGTSQTFTITVKPTPTVNAVANQVLCHNAGTNTITFTGDVAGTAYTWTNSDPSIGLAASGTGDISSFTAINNGDDPVVATISVLPKADGCDGAVKTFTITVNPQPKASISGGSFCKSGNQQLTVTSGQQGGTFSAPAGLSISANGLINLETSTPGTYTVTYNFTNGNCTNTTTASVEVKALTKITSEPAAQTICAGNSATFSVTASGEGTLSYQWRKDGDAITGANGATYTVSNAAAANAGSYDVIVTGACGSVTSAAVTLVVNPIPATPTINRNGASTFCQGGNVVLSSSATTGNQWYKNGAIIAGATSQTYTATESGSYTVMVTLSNCASGTSAAEVVTVTPLPATPVISASGNILSSSSNTGNQWFLNGVMINNATGNTHRVQAPGLYTVQVTQNGCSSTSAAYNFVATAVAGPALWNGEVAAYPNPANRNLYIKNSGARKLQVQVYNVFGHKVYEGKVLSAQGVISVDSWASGAYQVVIKDLTRNETVTQSIIKL